jgi:hypothetical protein
VPVAAGLACLDQRLLFVSQHQLPSLRNWTVDNIADIDNMNTRTPLQTAPAANVLSVSFNDDCSCFAVGLETGFCSELPPVDVDDREEDHPPMSFRILTPFSL